MTIGYALVFALYISSTVFTVSRLQHASSADSISSLRFDLGNDIAICVLWGMLFLFYLLRLLYLLKLNRKRQVAARGDTHLLASGQPAMEGQKVVSPLVIKYQFVWRNGIVVAGITLLAFVLVFGLFSIPFFLWGNQVFGNLLGSFNWVLIVLGVVFVVVIGGIVIWSTRASSNIDVVAFSNGLLKKTSMKEQFILWVDVRLVAIDSKARIEGEYKPMMLEVASKDEMIQFPWVYQQRTWRTLFIVPQPVVPFEVYEGQMQALLKVLVGETRLPLYDLDKGR